LRKNRLVFYQCGYFTSHKQSAQKTQILLFSMEKGLDWQQTWCYVHPFKPQYMHGRCQSKLLFFCYQKHCILEAINPGQCICDRFSYFMITILIIIWIGTVNPFEPELKIEIVPRWYYITLCIRTCLTVILLRTGTVGSVRLSRLISFNISFSV
jgi:hypothetical protein